MKTTGTIPGARPAPAPAPDLRLLLNEELARRCARNAQYSLRAFAKFLGVDHSTLSQLLRRKRSFSATMVKKLGTRLGLSGEEIATQLSRTAARTTGREMDTTSNTTSERVMQLTRDAATILTDWRHLAILELLQLENFEPDSRWIARMLGITVDEVNIALQRLMHLGLLEMKSTREWIDCCGDAVLVSDHFTAVTLARLGAELSALSNAHEYPGHYRTSTMALDSRQLDTVMQLLEQLRRELAGLQRGAACHDAVYRIDISLVPLTRAESKPQEP